LLPLLMQNALNYPVETAGWALAPRGVASLASSYLVGQLVGKVDARLLVGFGLAMCAVSFWQMSGLSPDMDTGLIVVSGLVQGFGSGFIFIPLSTMAFATLEPRLRAEATGFYNLARNLGGSVGISAVVAAYTRYTQVSHARLTEFVRPDNPLL